MLGISVLHILPKVEEKEEEGCEEMDKVPGEGASNFLATSCLLNVEDQEEEGNEDMDVGLDGPLMTPHSFQPSPPEAESSIAEIQKMLSASWVNGKYEGSKSKAIVLRCTGKECWGMIF